MRRKQVLAVMMALAMVATIGAPAIKADAAGLTQAANANVVAYGTLAAADVAAIKNIFDVEYYKAQNPELVEILGDDYNTLFEHFCKCGIFEGRTCTPNFDPAAYASAYADLKAAFGKDIVKYYEHYLSRSVQENRTITTVAACIEAGLTVETLAKEEVRISPAVYKVAQLMGTNDYKSVEAAMTRASSSSAVAVTTDEGTFVIANEKDAEALEKAKDLEEIDATLKCTPTEENGNAYGNLHIYFVKNSSGIGAYKIDDNSLVCSTQGYEERNDESIAEIGYIDISIYHDDTSEEYDVKPYSPMGTPYYEFTENVTKTVDRGVTGNKIHSWSSWRGFTEEDKDYEYKVTAHEAATDYYKYDGTGVLKGYYSDDNGTTHIFANEQEMNEWREKHGSWETTMHHKEFAAIDVDGTASTEYSVGMSMEENADGTLGVTIGISNEENNFTYVNEMTLTKEEVERN